MLIVKYFPSFIFITTYSTFQGGVTGTRGFEVRLEGSLSNFRCAIIHLDAFLTMDDTSVSKLWRVMRTVKPV